MANDQYYSGAKLLLLNVALSLGTFIQVLDTSIANVAIPYIAGNLSVSADEGTWVITSFSVSNAIVLPLTGWLSDYFGRVRLFVYSLILFAIMSFLCGFSWSLTMLVVCRVLQGAVAGTLIPLSQSLLIANNPPVHQGTALGLWGVVVVVAPVLGPIIGGYLTDVYSWPWIFYINVPVCIFSAGVAWFLLKDRESKIVRNPIDWIGLFFLALAVACTQIMLDKGKDLDWFDSNYIVALTITAIIALAYFIVWNWFEKYPIVDFSSFKNRNFFIGTTITTIGYLLFFGSTVTVPLWLQTEEGYTSFWAGVAVAPIGIAPLFLSTLVGKYMGRFDLRLIVALSFFFFAIGYFAQANFITEVDINTVMWARFFQGFGVAIFFIPLVQLSMGEIPPDKYASATGVFHFFRILVGSGFGTSLSIEIWTHLEEFHHGRLSEYVTIYRSVTTQFYDYLHNHSVLFSDPVINRVVDRLVEQQAFMLSTNDLSWLAAWTFIFMMPIPYLCRRVKAAAPAAGAAH